MIIMMYKLKFNLIDFNILFLTVNNLSMETKKCEINHGKPETWNTMCAQTKNEKRGMNADILRGVLK